MPKRSRLKKDEWGRPQKRLSVIDIVAKEAYPSTEDLVKIHIGKPTSADYEEIQRMIDEGYHTGISRPYGINWELKSKK